MEDKIRVVIADDLESERMLLKIAFRNARGFDVVGEVEDGVELIRYLSGSGKFADRRAYPWPDILFLDLKMPRRSGFEVLEWLKSNPPENRPRSSYLQDRMRTATARGPSPSARTDSR